MKLSTGKAIIPIEFDNGEKATISFNPHDRSIQERIKNFEDSLQKRMRQIDTEKYEKFFGEEKKIEINLENFDELINLSGDDLKSFNEQMSAVNALEEEYNKAVRDELDVIFDSKISDVVFKYCQPFDTVAFEEDGKEKREIYIMHFLRILAIEMKKYGEQNKDAMDKYLGKYGK